MIHWLEMLPDHLCLCDKCSAMLVLFVISSSPRAWEVGVIPSLQMRVKHRQVR